MIEPIISTRFLAMLIVFVIWEGIWKSIGLWKSARNNNLVWFICILVLNTAGILPIIYIFAFSKKKVAKVSRKKR